SVLWDDENLYVAYWIEEPFIRAKFEKRDSPIYYDNDVECFVAGRDAYYEFEINAYGTIYEGVFIWNDAYESSYAALPEFRLKQKKVVPFNGVGFKDHSRGKRRGFLAWDLPGLKSAVHIDGTTNDDSDRDRGWTVEVAFPWSSLRVLAAADGRAVPPLDGDVWRMDFSRFNQFKEATPVQERGGWSWSRHGVWDSHIPELFTKITFSRTPLEKVAPAAHRITAPGVKPRMILREGAGEGPAWDPKLGLLFSGHGDIGRLDRRGNLSTHRKGAGTNGLLFDAQGRLIACEPKYRRVTRTELDGAVRVLTDKYDGKRYNQPNDLCVDTRGRIYFTDPRYGPREGMEIVDAAGREVEGVYRIDTDGKVRRVITHEVERPNGIELSPDERHLFIADNNNGTSIESRKLWRFQMTTEGDIELKSRSLIYDWGASRGPDGMVFDARGRLYVAGGRNVARPPFETNGELGGVYVFSPEGQLLAFYHVPRDEVTNCTFGDDDLRTLYITAGGTLWTLRTLTPGHVTWPWR
ncbi:MAG: SMP-30/gluconolactonase/LRE family protein, partial [Planctomycetota bacterium]